MVAFFEAMRAKATYICQAEEVGIAAPYFSELAQSMEGRDVVHFADNRAANAGAINGASSSPDMARIVSRMRTSCRTHRLFVRSRSAGATNLRCIRARLCASSSGHSPIQARGKQV